MTPTLKYSDLTDTVYIVDGEKKYDVTTKFEVIVSMRELAQT